MLFVSKLSIFLRYEVEVGNSNKIIEAPQLPPDDNDFSTVFANGFSVLVSRLAKEINLCFHFPGISVDNSLNLEYHQV